MIDTELERDINRYGELVEIIVSDIRITDTYGTRYRRRDYEAARSGVLRRSGARRRAIRGIRRHQNVSSILYSISYSTTPDSLQILTLYLELFSEDYC